MIQKLLINFLKKNYCMESDCVSESIDRTSLLPSMKYIVGLFTTAEIYGSRFLFLNIGKDLRPDLPSPDL